MSDFNTATGLGDPGEATKISPDAGIVLFRTQGGGVRGRRDYASTRYRLRVVYDYLDSTDTAAVLSHFDGGPTTAHTITIDGVLYNFLYANRPRVKAYHGDRRTIEFDAEAWV